jgi:hypothetical protein
MGSNKIETTFNGNLIGMGDHLRVEFGPDLFMWVLVAKVMTRSVKATIVEHGPAPYLYGRVMDIWLEYVREYRSKDNPPPLWGLSQNLDKFVA